MVALILATKSSCIKAVEESVLCKGMTKVAEGLNGEGEEIIMDVLKACGLLIAMIVLLSGLVFSGKAIKWFIATK